jgi:Uma2 family endonuclease
MWTVLWNEVEPHARYIERRPASMATAATKLMTADEFFEWVHRPENQDMEYDLVRGEVVGMPKPGKRHGLVCTNISWIFGNFARQRKKGYVCSNDTGLVVETDPDTVRGPDLSFFEDVTRYEDVEIGFGRTPPLLAIEVLSPYDAHAKVMERVVDQLKFGTRLVWVVDPEARSVAVHRPGRDPYVVHADEEITGEDVLPDFRCKVSEFFKLPGE